MKYDKPIKKNFFLKTNSVRNLTTGQTTFFNFNIFHFTSYTEFRKLVITTDTYVQILITYVCVYVSSPV